MALNTENLQILIDHMKVMPKRAFNMGDWLMGPAGAYNFAGQLEQDQAKAIIEAQKTAERGHPCKTVACIAGEAVLLAKARGEELGALGFAPAAAEWLGLTLGQSMALFTPGMDDLPAKRTGGMVGISKDEAIRTLEKLLETGEVDWSHLVKPRKKKETA